MEAVRGKDDPGRARVLDANGQVDLAEQRPATGHLPRLQGAGASKRDLAYVPRRTYASWSHDKGVPGKVVAKLMGHTNADVTLNVYTQVMDDSLRTAVDRVGGELFTIVHQPGGAGVLTH
jgi:integrase